MTDHAPMPQGTALRWTAQQIMHLEQEGFNAEVLQTIRPLLMTYAQSGEQGHMLLVHRLLMGDQ